MQRGFVTKGLGRRGYALGARILYLSHACLQVDLPRRAQSALDRINESTGETVHLAALQGDEFVTVLKREARHAVRVDAGALGTSDAAHATATGKAMLAWLPEDEIRRIVMGRGMTRFTPHTITDFDALIEALRLVRRNGVCFRSRGIPARRRLRRRRDPRPFGRGGRIDQRLDAEHAGERGASRPDAGRGHRRNPRTVGGTGCAAVRQRARQTALVPNHINSLSEETWMNAPAKMNAQIGAHVKTSKDFPIPASMKAWVLGDPGELSLKREAGAGAEARPRCWCGSTRSRSAPPIWRIIYHGPPAMIEGGLPFNKNWTPGHEYMGTVVALGPGVDEYRIGERVTVEIHAGCGQCKRCREGMYTSCHNYGLNYGDVDKGHRANGFTTDGGFCEYQVNHINTLVSIADDMSDEEATLVVTAGTAMYGLTELGGLVAGESVVVTGPGPIGLLGVAVAKAMGAFPVILTGTRDNRLKIGLELGADHVVNVRNENAVEAVHRLNGGKGVDYVIECSAAPDAVNDAVHMVNRGGKVCLAAFTAREDAGRYRAYRAQQHLPLRHPRRGQERDPPRRGLHAAEAVRRHQDPHPHVRARRSADRVTIRQGADRRRHQGGGQGARRRRPKRRGRGVASPPIACRHCPRKRAIQYSGRSSRDVDLRHAKRSTGCPAFAGHDEQSM